MKLFISLLSGLGVALPVSAMATDFTWTPLVTTAMFEGIRTDVVTACSAIFFILLVIAGFALIWKVTGR